jgi:hypothetical protein
VFFCVTVKQVNFPVLSSIMRQDATDSNPWPMDLSLVVRALAGQPDRHVRRDEGAGAVQRQGGDWQEAEERQNGKGRSGR